MQDATGKGWIFHAFYWLDLISIRAKGKQFSSIFPVSIASSIVRSSLAIVSAALFLWFMVKVYFFIWFLFGAIEPPTIPAISTGTGGESIGEPDEDNPRTLDTLPVANVRTIIRPISTGGAVIIPKLPNLGGRLVV